MKNNGNKKIELDTPILTRPGNWSCLGYQECLNEHGKDNISWTCSHCPKVLPGEGASQGKTIFVMTNFSGRIELSKGIAETLEIIIDTTAEAIVAS